MRCDRVASRRATRTGVEDRSKDQWMNQKRRSWLGTLSRISLKMSLVLVAVVAVAMAWVADAWHQRQRETALLNRMQQSLSLTLSIEKPSSGGELLVLT